MSKLTQVLGRPATCTCSTRCDLRHLATLAQFWHESGEAPRSISEMIRLSLEVFTELLVNNGNTTFIPSQDEALDVIQKLGLRGVKMQPKNLADAISMEHLDKTVASPSLRSPKIGPITGDSPEALMAKTEFEKRLQDLDQSLKALSDVPPIE